MADTPPLSLTEREILEQYARGRRLQLLAKSEGWDDLVELMNKRVEQAEHNLINYNGCDVEAIKALHRRARTMREFSQTLQQQVLESIENADNIPRMISRQDELDQELGNELY